MLTLRGRGRVASPGADARVAAFNPDQPRDERGRWSDGGGGFEGGTDSNPAIGDGGSDDRDLGLDADQFPEPRRDADAIRVADSGEVKSDASPAQGASAATPHLMPQSQLEGIIERSRKDEISFINGKHETQCVDLIIHTMGAPGTSQWEEGTKITRQNVHSIAIGTPIATFRDGKYPNDRTGQHAAIFIGYDDKGIKVIDQWQSTDGPRPVLERRIPWDPDRNHPRYSPSNDGSRFSVVLWPDKK